MAGTLPLIRPARPEDVPGLLPLLRALFEIEPDFTFDAPKAEAGLTALLAQPRAVVLVAEACNGPAGFATMQELLSTAEGGPVGLIEDVVLDPAWRGRGAGRQLLDALLGIAWERGYARVQLLVDDENVTAQAFYQRQGGQATRLRAVRFRPQENAPW